MINTKISIEDKLELVYKFFQQVWGTDLIKDERSSPPTPEAMLKNINENAFPALKILELENLWHKARMFFYIAGDKDMLEIEGDYTKEQEELDTQRFYNSDLESQRISELLQKGDETDEPEIQAYEKKIGCRFARFPKIIEREYVGIFESYEQGQIKLKDNSQTFPAYGMNEKMVLGDFDLTKPITIVTVEMQLKDKKDSERVVKIMQENL